MVSAVSNDMNVSLSKLEKFVTKAKNKHTTSKSRFQVNVMKNMMGKRLYGYFAKWKEFTMYKRNLMLTRMKDLILKNYKNYLTSVMVKFKEGGQVTTQKKKKKKMIIMEMENE